VRFPDYDFIYHIFHEVLDELPEVSINPGEHKDFQWVEPAKTLGLPLMMDEDACIKMFFRIE